MCCVIAEKATRGWGHVCVWSATGIIRQMRKGLSGQRLLGLFALSHNTDY